MLVKAETVKKLLFCLRRKEVSLWKGGGAFSDQNIESWEAKKTDLSQAIWPNRTVRTELVLNKMTFARL
jgi:hypothetical protein